MNGTLANYSCPLMEATLQSILHLLAWNGYEDEAYKASMTCKEAWIDNRILFPYIVSKVDYGETRASLIGLTVRNGYENDSTSLERVKQLVRVGGNPDLPCKKKKFTPLQEACLYGDSTLMESFQFLLSCNVNPNGHAKFWAPLSLLGTLNNSSKKMQLLLDHGADLDHMNDNGDSILNAICSYEKDTSPSSLEFLCKKGANVHLLDNNGYTAIDNALLHGNANLAEVLKRHGAKITYERIMEAVLYRNYNNCVKFLIKQGYRIPDDALVEAIEDKNPEKVLFLLQCGASPNAPHFGKPPLFHAVDVLLPTTVEIVQALCNFGANVNAKAEVEHYNIFNMESIRKVETCICELLRQYSYRTNPDILEIIRILLAKGAKPPATLDELGISHAHMNKLNYIELNRMLLKARMTPKKK